jgi:hypothetical protein
MKGTRKPGSNMHTGGAGTPSNATSKSGSLDKEVQTKIGQQLRAMYDDVVRQGVPDRFADLLKQLERSDDREDEESRS